MLDLHRLRVLREVARSGSLTRAAGRLAYTPSAVSQQIATLERDAGTVLLERHARGARLTEAGRVLVAHTERILAELRSAETSLAAIGRSAAGRLRFGSFTTANAALMPRAAAAFRRQHPGVTLELLEVDTDEALRMVAERALDLALVYEFPVVPLTRPSTVELTPSCATSSTSRCPPGTGWLTGAGCGWRSSRRRLGSRASTGGRRSMCSRAPAGGPGSSRRSRSVPMTR